MVNINNLIDLQEIKAHLNLADDFDLDDELLSIYAVTALEVAQRHIGKTFIKKQIKLFPSTNQLRLDA